MQYYTRYENELEIEYFVENSDLDVIKTCVNLALEDALRLINQGRLTEGWTMKVVPNNNGSSIRLLKDSIQHISEADRVYAEMVAHSVRFDY